MVLVTQSSSHAFWLASALGSDAQVIPVAGDLATLHAAISAPGLGVVVVDFSAPMTEAAITLVGELRAAFPGVVIMGAGSAAEPASMRAALRCGVAEFIDWDASNPRPMWPSGISCMHAVSCLRRWRWSRKPKVLPCLCWGTCGHGCDHAGNASGRDVPGNACL